MTDHLNALRVRLSHERGYLATTITEGERELRRVWIAQIEREIAQEEKFLSISGDALVAMTDDELLAALEA